MWPPLLAASRICPGNAGSGCAAAGRRGASPNRPSNRSGPKPTVAVSLDAVSPAASPVSAGGAASEVESPGTAAPRVIASAAAVQTCIKVIRSARSVAVTSNAANASRSWRRW